MRSSLLILAASFFLIAARPPHYRLDAHLDPARETLDATVRIRVDPQPSGAEQRFILGRSFTVQQASATGGSVKVEPTEQPFPGALQAIVFKPRPGVRTPQTVTVRYSGKLMALQQPPMNSINGQLIELTVDSMWLPFPADLVTGLTAEADFSGIPRNAVVVSNGEVRRIGRRVHVSVRRKGDLALIASPALKQLREGRFQFHAPDPSAAAVQVYRRSGPEALAMMEQILGPIPGNHVRVTVVDRESVAGYNRPGYIVVPSRKPDTEPASLAMSLAHEIAHSWFSKANFMTEDFWLIEAPADYLAHRYGEETLGTDVVRPFLQKAQRRAEKSGSVLGRGRPNDDAAYGRGNMLLRSLEHRIGKPAIDGFLREFAALDEHTTRSFLDLLAARQGGALAAEFEASLRAKDYRPLSPRENPPPA